MKSLWIRATALAALAVLAACGHSGSGPQTVGVGIGVALTAPAGTTIVAQGGTIEIDATVSNDASNAGVTWTLIGSSGSIKSSDKTKAVYQAPTGIVGAVYATLTATSITDPTKTSSVTLTVNGTPTILTPVLFPANQNVPYVVYLSVAGGTAPYTWTISSGTLPAGLALGTSTAATTAISGTPTALGTSPITLSLKDNAGLTASVNLTITVNPQTSCLLTGQFAYLATGFFEAKPVTRIGSVNVTSTGTVTGVHDYKDSTNVRPATAVTSGTCVTLTANRGQLHISSGASGNETFDFATTASLKRGHLQQDDGTGVVEAGEFYAQDPTAFNLAALAGDWVFGAVGDDGSGHRLTVAGRLTLGATGAIGANSTGDATTVTAISNAALTGTFAAPDANGRGSAALSVGAQALPVAYYVIDANTLLIATNDSSASTPRIAGRMTRQVGAGTLDSTAFSSASVLSLWGSSLVNGVPSATMSAGRLSASTATAGAAAGTVKVEIDVADRGTSLVNQSFTGANYTVGSYGRTTLSFGTGAAQRNFVVYADGAGGGYVVEPGSAVGNFGILEAQAPAPFSDFAAAYYIGGTLFPGATSPITLAPQLLFQSGSITGNLSGSYALDPTTGRMIAAVSRTVLGGSDVVIYIVSPSKLVIVGDNLNITNSQLAWFEIF
jgi:hypothetical protein